MSKTAATTAVATTPWEKLGIGTAPITIVPDLLDIAVSCEPRYTLCLVGETGIGKTPIIHQWCKKRGGFMRAFNLGHVTPEEISMSMFNEDGTQYDFVPPSWLLELNDQAEKTGLGVLFWDEFNRGEKSLVNSFFTLADERRIHNFHLHPNVLIVAAMNPSGGTYMVNKAENDHAIRKRLNLVYVTHDLAGWLRHGQEAGFHPLVLDFVRARSALFYDTAARDAGKAFTCPSNWEKVSTTLKAAKKQGVPHTSSALRMLIEGQIGSTAGQAFMEFLQDQSTVIQPDDVLLHYRTKGRPRVARLLGMTIGQNGKFMRDASITNVRIDVLTDLNKGLALTLLGERPDPQDIGTNLAAYLLDVPDEIYIAFWSEHMKSALKDSPEERSFIRELNNVLRENKDYQYRVARMVEVQKQLAKSVSSVQS